jgi:hypothetical protein
MNAKDVVEKLKEVLLGATEEVVETPAVEEQVELQEEVATEEVQEELAAPMEDEASPEDSAEDSVEAAPAYVTEEKLNQEIAQLRAMIDEIMSGMGAEDSKDVPQELSADEVEQPQEEVELAAEEEVAELKHDPEAMVESKELNLYAQSRRQSTFDKVLSKISNK